MSHWMGQDLLVAAQVDRDAREEIAGDARAAEELHELEVQAEGLAMEAEYVEQVRAEQREAIDAGQGDQLEAGSAIAAAGDEPPWVEAFDGPHPYQETADADDGAWL